MVKDIKYSIIVTAYNYEKFLRLCLDSCLEQSPDIAYEIIVINDGSTDSTEEILKEYDFPILSYYTIPNSGIEAASNFGFQKAKGEYLIRVDADDQLVSNYLDIVDQYIDSSKEKFYYPNYYVVDNEGKILETVELPEYARNEVLGRGDFLATGTVYRKDYLKKIGFYPTLNKNTGLENYELILSLLQSGIEGLRIPDQLFYYRRHSLNMSGVKKDKIIDYGRQLFKRLKIGSFETNENHPYKLKL